MRLSVVLVAVSLVVAAPVRAEPKINVQGLVLGSENARYVKGVPTLDLQQQHGAVQVRFLGWDHSNAVFAVGFFNSGLEPVNVGLENLHASADGQPVRLFTVDELTRQAKSRATWRRIGLAFLGGLGAAAAASQRSTYSGTITSPYGGMYSFSGSYPSLAGQLQADRISANTAANMTMIRYQLDATIAAIGDKVIQTTTVDPGTAFGGLMVVEKLDYGKAPLEFHLDVDFNGERYSFGYLLLKKGQAAPAEYASRLASKSKPRALPDRGSQSSSKAPPVSTDPAPRNVTQGAIHLTSGAVKFPADTPSGYCLRTPPGYIGSGSLNAPAISKALPRCDISARN